MSPATIKSKCVLLNYYTFTIVLIEIDNFRERVDSYYFYWFLAIIFCLNEKKKLAFNVLPISGGRKGSKYHF